MKISLNWLKELITLSEPTEEICDTLTMTGLEVEGLEKFESIQGSLSGVVIGEVITCEKHSNADKLKVTTVDIGDATVPIVCGAPNVAAGQKVVVAKAGSTIYPVNGDPFTLKKVKIRGEVSEGMICAEDELGLGTDHSGIIVLETDIPNGTPAAEYFEIVQDEVIEIGLTPNRGDGASHLGVARDLRAVYHRPVSLPQVDRFYTEDHATELKVRVDDQSGCPRYSGVEIHGLRVQESPAWLKNRLKAIGIGPINNIVDVTNYVCHELGQPLHAFDLEAITTNEIVVKTMPEGTSFTSLDEVERKLSSTDLMICNGDHDGMCIGGVFGGIKSGVKESTTSIFLESAYFSPDYIRRSVQKHGLKTDASFRFERGTDPENTIYALKRATLLIQEVAGGTAKGDVIDIYPTRVPPFEVKVKYRNVNRLIGKEIPREQITEILNYLDIEIEDADDHFLATVPAYRSDVTREADVIEEILRIYGLNNIEMPEYNRADHIAEFPEVDTEKIQYTISEMLASNGYNEILTNSLTNPEYISENPGFAESQNVSILNKLSPELGVLRQTNLFHGLEVISYNINRKQTDLKLFEFGQNYFNKGNKYVEKQRLSVYTTGNTEKESWQKPTEQVTFHDIVGTVQMIIRRLSKGKLSRVTLEAHPTLEYGLQLLLDGKNIAFVGKVKNSISSRFGIRQEIFYAEVEWNLLLPKRSNNIVYAEISKYPEVRRDLSLVIDKSVSFEDIKRVAEKVEKKYIKEVNVFDVYEGERIQEGKKAYALSFILQDNEKTLTDKVIDKTMKKLMQAFEKDAGAHIRQ